MGEAPQRIGVYGGTFDPIHAVHLAIARAARAHAGLDRVVFVVAARPPHKRGEVTAGAEDRFAMVEAALRGEPGMEASRIEIDRDGPSYTADTLRLLQARFPGAALFLIVGYDTLLDLPKWREPEAVIALARLLVAPRAEAAAPIPPAPIPPAFRGRVETIPFEASDVSSTGIRERLAAGEPVGGALPPAVEALIRARGLYHARG